HNLRVTFRVEHPRGAEPAHTPPFGGAAFPSPKWRGFSDYPLKNQKPSRPPAPASLRWTALSPARIVAFDRAARDAAVRYPKSQNWGHPPSSTRAVETRGPPSFPRWKRRTQNTTMRGNQS